MTDTHFKKKTEPTISKSLTSISVRVYRFKTDLNFLSFLIIFAFYFKKFNQFLSFFQLFFFYHTIKILIINIF